MGSYVSFGLCPNSSEPLVRRTLNFPHSLKPVQLFQDSKPDAATCSLKSLPDIPSAKTTSFSSELIHREKIIQEKLLSESDDSFFACSAESSAKREKSMTPVNSVEEESFFPSKESDEPLPSDVKNSLKYEEALQSSPPIPIPTGKYDNRRRPESSNTSSSKDLSCKFSSIPSEEYLFSFEDSNEPNLLLSARRRPSLDFITPLRLDPSEDSIKDGDET